MALDSEESEGPRLANISAVLLLETAADSKPGARAPRSEPAEVARLSSLLGTIFQDVLVLGDEKPAAGLSDVTASLAGVASRSVEALVIALNAAREGRVLLLSQGASRVTADLLLALTAWPEQDVVVPREAGRVWHSCALYRRREVLAAIRGRSLEAGLGVESLVAELDCGFIEGDDLAVLIPSEN